MTSETIEKRRADHAAYMRKWRARTPLVDAAYQRDYRARNPDKVMERNRRRRDSGKAKEYALKTRYGISVAERDAMLAAQKGGCAICGASEPGWKHNWVVDHCHQTKRIRGILCHNCNVVLGHAKDSSEVLRAMISYLGAVT